MIEVRCPPSVVRRLFGDDSVSVERVGHDFDSIAREMLAAAHSSEGWPRTHDQRRLTSYPHPLTSRTMSIHPF